MKQQEDRRRRVIKRLEIQLESGVKTVVLEVEDNTSPEQVKDALKLKDFDINSKYTKFRKNQVLVSVSLTEANKERILKEISVLKSRS
jgi:uncharacterized protein (UPF0371 family)